MISLHQSSQKTSSTTRTTRQLVGSRSSKTTLPSFLCLLFFFLVETPTNDAYVVLSREATSFAVDALLDPISRKLVNTGVLFRDEHAEITAFGQTDTQCIMSIGDIRGFDRNVHESPQFCVSVANFPRFSEISYGIVAGVAGKQATLYRMEFLGEYDEAPLLDPLNLPVETFPVDLATDADGGVYVGLHDTGGALVKAGGKPLEHVLQYIDAMTKPDLAPVVNPLAMKVNMTSGQVVWQTEFTTTEGRSIIGATIHIPSRNLLVVVGSSDGKGTAVGGDDNGDDWDGYVTKVDAENGNIDDLANNYPSSLRIDSQPGLDDFVYGICASEDEIFIVGSTRGVLEGDSGFDSGGAFVMKVALDTLDILWKKQIRGTGDNAHLVAATKCGVRAETLYVAGEVPAGVLMEQDDARTKASDNQDVLAIAMDASNLEIIWVRQIDSRREDYLCNIMIAANGDLLVMGNGADFEKETNDVYFMSVTLLGGLHDWLGLPDDVDPIYGYIAGVGDDDDADDFVPGNEDDDEDDDNKTTIIIVAVVVPVVALFLLVAIYGVVTAKRGEQEIKTSEQGANKHSSSMTTESHTGDGQMLT
jgi:hypothetical protein